MIEHKDLLDYSIGSNVIYSTHEIGDILLNNGTKKVLDLGSGFGLSSIILSKITKADFISIDKYIDPSTCYDLMKKYNTSRVFPLKTDIKDLEFPKAFFDAIICLNSYSYFGTSDKFLPWILNFLKEDGLYYISDISLQNEIGSLEDIPGIIKEDYFDYWQHIHSMSHWKDKFEKCGLLKGITNSYLKNEDILKEDYIKNGNDAFSKALSKDYENHIRYFSIYGFRNSKTSFYETF